MSLRDIKMERTRESIADVAFTLFEAQGFTATTVGEIAAEAEVGSRTVYRYFPTKEELVLSGFKKVFDTALADVRACPAETPIPDVLRTVLESVVQSNLELPKQLRGAYEIITTTPSVRAHFAQSIRAWEADLRREVADRLGGRSAEAIAGLAVAQTAAVFILAFEDWYASGGRADLRKLTRTALDLLHADKVPVPARIQ
ncbi:TetR/AcrR family transcriptional regulator [Amycolatopsis carbonis]|uniref:TetR/AcrR family transcriptional regulator n=1 Tax=Amycolatopsis carbonis TaxID=715471 RepID=A0A9Y2IPI3_9PSEU|nr:TetR/AcrR family transcriptional regulator [Amycolatopsis sp. 2-15]WIX83714.1 TetR/AcrR family transcriptional regulator [Amycolatopsis sp. 2-15]